MTDRRTLPLRLLTDCSLPGLLKKLKAEVPVIDPDVVAGLKKHLQPLVIRLVAIVGDRKKTPLFQALRKKKAELRILLK